MNSTDGRSRVYGPEALNTMGWAFDKAFEGLSQESKRQPNMRRNLAVCIIRLFDEGEVNPLCLSRMALAVVTVSDRKRVSNGDIAYSTIGVPFPSGTDGWPVAA